MRFLWVGVLLAALLAAKAYAQAPVASGYLIEPSTCAKNGTSTTVIKVTYPFTTGSPYPTVLTFAPHYTFNSSNATAVAMGQVFVPKQIVMPLPWCSASMLTYGATGNTPGCSGLWYYGYQSVAPNYGISQPGFDGIWAPYAGIYIAPFVDLGSQSKGTLTWFRPATCPEVNPTFSLNMTMTGLTNWYLNDIPGAMLYDDQGLIDRCTLFSLNCTLYTRPNNAARFDPQAGVYPVCRQVLPYSSNLSSVDYAALYSSVSNKGPSNVAVGAVVYQLRLDNLPAPGAAFIYLSMHYVNGTGVPSTLTAYTATFDNVLYVASAGVSPALVYASYYNLQPPLDPVNNPYSNISIFNEYNAGFLPVCICGTNVLCNSTDYSLNGTVPRTSVPGYNNPPSSSLVPSCVIVVNNGAAPYINVPFGMYVNGLFGTGSYSFTWAFDPSLSSVASLFPFTGSSTTATVNSVITGTVSVVVGSGGLSGVCSASFTVVPARPQVSVTPSPSVIAPINTLLGLDATGSYSPDLTPLIYNWTIVFFTPGTGYNFTNTAAPVAGLIANQTSYFKVVFVATNSHGNNDTTIDIYFVNGTVPTGPVAPGGAPSVPSVGDCNVQQAPGTPIPDGPLAPPFVPITPAPNPPGSPSTTPSTSPSTSPSALVPATTPSGIIGWMGVLIGGVIIVVVLWYVIRKLTSGASAPRSYSKVPQKPRVGL
jgi:hypothetical protein